LTEDITSLRNYIQEWIDAQHPKVTWNGLFTKAGLSNGSATNWRKGTIKKFPRVETIYKLSDAMGLDRSKLLAVAGMYGEQSETVTRTEPAGELTPREAGLLEAFRSLSEGYQSIVYSQVTAMAYAN
jgi:transcriptional regulator with XRE-family HTH domain|tara:strand:+ start:125 stop:505 length:381 start_codon:yes stop_codon:yes gene_type:complete